MEVFLPCRELELEPGAEPLSRPCRLSLSLSLSLDVDLVLRCIFV